VVSIVYTHGAIDDLDRLAEFLLATDPKAAVQAGPLIMSAVGALAMHPLLGGRTSNENRELVISRGRTGYLALYSFDPVNQVVLVRAIRHQRETGFEED
jgi:plasmid stabilization system protein ParE